MLGSGTKTKISFLAGHCMSPALKEGWLIESIPADLEEIKIGDVLIYSKFNSNEPFICQRVLCKVKLGKQLFFLMRGDNTIYHGLIASKYIVGKVTDAWDIINHRKVDREIWQRKSFLLSFYNSFFCYSYIVLYYIKLAIIGKKRHAITSLIHKYCCKAHYLLPKICGKLKDNLSRLLRLV